MNEKLSLYQILLAVGMLLTGSINTLSKKAQNQCTSYGIDDLHKTKLRKFEHPWFQTLIMFAGEALCLLGFCYSSRKDAQLLKMQLLIDQDSTNVIKLNRKRNRIVQNLIFILPTACDLIGTTLSGIGLLYVDASVWQMLRGSIIVFTGVFSKFFLKRKLKASHWFGIAVTTLGLLLVGLASILKPRHSESQWHTILGITLIIISQIVGATQMVLEETFLKGKGFEPFHVVGMEGLFGCFIMSAVVLPVLQHIPGSQPGNSYENSLDALVMIKNNKLLIIFSVVYLLSIAFYNFFGLSVTRSMTAVHRTLLDACRTCVVWVCSLILYYGNGHYGEPFDKQYGLIQIDGFLLLLFGTAIYNQLFDFSWIPCAKKINPAFYDVQHPEIVDNTYVVTNAADNEASDEQKRYHGFLDD
ncbi:solute carrier family 35 member F6 isoform X2 [Hydra vulgaris]|uniref:Solute carrier family 35 member F6 isoform X2 n=1 Tax=Hydra vulgaris TaxID=6087 RepID=A0ABM4CTD1_HYDVU